MQNPTGRPCNGCPAPAPGFTRKRRQPPIRVPRTGVRRGCVEHRSRQTGLSRECPISGFPEDRLGRGGRLQNSRPRRPNKWLPLRRDRRAPPGSCRFCSSLPASSSRCKSRSPGTRPAADRTWKRRRPLSTTLRAARAYRPRQRPRFQRRRQPRRRLQRLPRLRRRPPLRLRLRRRRPRHRRHRAGFRPRDRPRRGAAPRRWPICPRTPTPPSRSSVPATPRGERA